MKRIPIGTFHIDRSTGEIVDPPAPTETPASLRALADEYDEQADRSEAMRATAAELRERAAEMERSRLSDPCSVCGWIRGEHGAAGLAWEDKCPRKDGGKWTGWLDTHFTPAQPQPHTAGKPTCDYMDLKKGCCTLAIGHKGAHQFDSLEFSVGPGSSSDCVYGHNGTIIAWAANGPNAIEIAAFIADALNVRAETGLTPRQLAEERESAMMLAEQLQTACAATDFQRDALAAQLEDASIDRFHGGLRGLSQRMEMNAAKAQLADATAALREIEEFERATGAPSYSAEIAREALAQP